MMKQGFGIMIVEITTDRTRKSDVNSRDEAHQYLYLNTSK